MCIRDRKGASPINHCWCKKTRVIAVSCGIKIFAVRCLVLSQYTHLTDGRTDGRTDRRTDRQNFDSNTVRCITCSRTVKMVIDICQQRVLYLGVGFTFSLSVQCTSYSACFREHVTTALLYRILYMYFILIFSPVHTVLGQVTWQHQLCHSMMVSGSNFRITHHHASHSVKQSCSVNERTEQYCRNR